MSVDNYWIPHVALQVQRAGQIQTQQCRLRENSISHVVAHCSPEKDSHHCHTSWQWPVELEQSDRTTLTKRLYNCNRFMQLWMYSTCIYDSMSCIRQQHLHTNRPHQLTPLAPGILYDGIYVIVLE